MEARDQERDYKSFLISPKLELLLERLNSKHRKRKDLSILPYFLHLCDLPLSPSYQTHSNGNNNILNSQWSNMKNITQFTCLFLQISGKKVKTRFPWIGKFFGRTWKIPYWQEIVSHCQISIKSVKLSYFSHLISI